MTCISARSSFIRIHSASISHHNLGDRQAEEIRHTKSAKEAWDTFMKLNESSTMANILRLKRELLTTKMKSANKVREHT